MPRPFELARTGLQEQCRVPLDYSASFITSIWMQLAALKTTRVGICCAKAGWRKWKIVPADAAKSDLDMICLGQRIGARRRHH